MNFKAWESLPFYGAVFALTWFVRDTPFFWDAIQLGSKHAHHFYENGLRWTALPATIDSGHPPVFGFYLAVVWRLFEKTLLVSHFAMLPFLLGIVFLLLRLGKRLGGAAWMVWLPLIALFDPVMAGQAVSISPDIPLVFFFLLSLEGVFSAKKGWLMVAIAGLCLISMRGMMTAGALFIWGIVRETESWNPRIFFKPVSENLRIWGAYLWPYTPGFLAAAVFLFWHYQTTGWIGHHPGSPWASAFQHVGFKGFLKNIAVFGWRWLDFGRLGEWLIFAGLFLYSEKNKASGNLMRLLLCLLIFLTPSMLLFQNLSAHRYFLPAFLALHLVVFQRIAQIDLPFFKKNMLFAALVLFLASGNLWHYPPGIAMGWDATLAHLPYHDLRREAIAFLERENIDFQKVGTAFPNINTTENTDLDGNSRCFAEKDFQKNEYILWSNVFNDFSREEFDLLEKNWQPLLKLERSGVCVFLYRKI